MTRFIVFIEDHEWREFVKRQTIKYEIPDTHLSDVLVKYFKTAEVEEIR